MELIGQGLLFISKTTDDRAPELSASELSTQIFEFILRRR